MTLPVQHIIHINLNCSDIEASKQLLEDFVGLSGGFHLRAEPQDGTGMDLGKDIQWDGWLMFDHRSLAGTGIDMLQWLNPLPKESPYKTPNNLGFSRLALFVPNLDTVYQKMVEEGINCFSKPVKSERTGRRFFCFTNYDGTLIELTEHKGVVEMGYVNINCSNLKRSRDWYEEVFGFRGDHGPVLEIQAGEILGLDQEFKTKSVGMHLPGREDHFGINLQEWISPKPVGKPYSSAVNLGLYRLAFAVDSVEECYEELKSMGADCPYPPTWLDMGPDIPIKNGLWALFFFDPDGTCMELIQNPEINE
jgi:catechol 2,3-dioxygenase-like lactoylglutathione lyase family enzyme